MTADLEKPCLGRTHRHLQAPSTIDGDRKKRKNRTAFCPDTKCMSLPAILVFLSLILTIGFRTVHHYYSQQAQAGSQTNGGAHFGTQDLGVHSQDPPTAPDSDGDAITLMTRPTVHEAFEGKIAFVVNQTTKVRDEWDTGRAEAFKTVIEPNRNVVQYGLTVFRNVCTRPDGAIVTVGISDDELLAEISQVPDLLFDWSSTYNCSPVECICMGYENIESQGFPSNARWIPGTTAHLIPSLIPHRENVFHNFADRLWPHVAGSVPPLNETFPHTPDHFLVHRICTWLFEAGHDMYRNTFMYQIRILGETAPEADFLAMNDLNAGEDLVCFEKLVLACTTCDRMSSKLAEDISSPATLNYRNRGLEFFGIPAPAIPLPPKRLRVVVYGRWDTKRRRITNVEEVVQHLQSYTNPPLLVTHIDKLLASQRYKQSLPEVVSLMAQTDILITVHGANTWATIFMPFHAAVIEIEGPCGPWSWMHVIAKALGLKHDTSNPWGTAVASPKAGNTTKCLNANNTPDMSVDLGKLDDAISRLAFPTFEAEDRIARHWKHNWQPHSSG